MPLNLTKRQLIVACAMFAGLLALWLGSGTDAIFSGARGAASHDVQPDAAQPKEQSSNRLPEFSFQDMSWNTVSSHQFRGKVLLLDVWATWCQPCKEEMPWFQEFHAKYKGEGLEVVGISIDALTSDIVKFVKEAGVTYPIVHRPQIMQEWGLLGLPTTFIVDREGRVRKKIVGFDYKETFEAAILELLADTN